MYFPWNTRSHRMQQNAILEGMLARGHRVTGVFPQKYKEKHQNYTEIIVQDRYEDRILTRSDLIESIELFQFQ